MEQLWKTLWRRLEALIKPTNTNIEIERKFLVKGLAWRRRKGIHCVQGYISRNARRTVRVRIAAETAFLTIKGPSTGISRSEFEYRIPLSHARKLLQMSETPPVEKIRRLIPYKGCTWEVDEFLGPNSGLVVAEIELSSETQTFQKPPWVGKEVTGDPKYTNSNLAVRPFLSWKRD